MRVGRAIAVTLFAAFISTGCVKLYANYKNTLDTRLDNTTLGAREGRASRHTVLWLFSWGDAGTAAAARDGGISTMNHLDSEFFQILYGLYTRETVIVHGD